MLQALGASRSDNFYHFFLKSLVDIKYVKTGHSEDRELET
jgi:hypothetical protein